MVGGMEAIMWRFGIEEVGAWMLYVGTLLRRSECNPVKVVVKRVLSTQYLMRTTAQSCNCHSIRTGPIVQYLSHDATWLVLHDWFAFDPTCPCTAMT
jgi:hypothetical protein